MSDDYDVGYGKPPKSGQFKPGQSGNSKGRPKGTKNLKTVLEAELKSKVTLKEGDKVKTLPKLEVLFKSVVNKALAGDPRATQNLITLIKELQPLSSDEAAQLSALSEEDLAVLESHADLLKLIEESKNGK